MTSKTARHKKNQRARKAQFAAAQSSATPAEIRSYDTERVTQEAESSDAGISVARSEVSEECPFEVKEIDGKGLGVVATRDIKARELILKEKPLVVWDDDDDIARLEAFVNALPETKKTAYYSHVAANPWKNLSTAAAIFKTNCLPLSGGIRGIFDIGCRLNHSCRPNCCSQFDDEQEVRWFIANRDIGKGEEICISYTELREVRLQRMGTLRVSFGFMCTCEVCTQPLQSALASDRRRLEYKRIYDSTSRLQYQPLDLIKAVNEGLRLAKAEGIVAGTSDLAYQAMTATIWFGDRTNAIRWIDKTLELEGYVAGVWSTRYKDIEAWKGEPTRHLGWKDVCRKLGLPSHVLIGPDRD